MEVQVRVRDKDSLARFLGWFSVGLGAAQVTAPRLVCRVVGASTDGVAPHVMRAMGARELTQGTGILVRPRPTAWLWSRVAGDLLDLSLLGVTAVKNRRARTALAIANVLAVTAPDVYESRYLSTKHGPVRSGQLIRKGVTINKPRNEVEAAWAAQPDLRDKVNAAGASARFGDAAGNRGVELVVEYRDDPPAGDLGRVVRKVSGRDLATQLADDLRRFKQHVETGQIVRSDSTPNGHLLADHLRQRAAQPLEEAVR